MRWRLDLRCRLNTIIYVLWYPCRSRYMKCYTGCIRLLSTPTYYIKACTGFLSLVKRKCSERLLTLTPVQRERQVLILLLDEMHRCILYVRILSLTSIQDKCTFKQQSLIHNTAPSPKVAKTIAVFMVLGLFNKLQFPYAQFPATDLSGDLLYDPFWEAVSRIEKSGLKVCL